MSADAAGRSAQCHLVFGSIAATKTFHDSYDLDMAYPDSVGLFNLYRQVVPAELFRLLLRRRHSCGTGSDGLPRWTEKQVKPARALTLTFVRTR